MSDIQERIEVWVGDAPSENRFDRLVAIRDEAQRLIMSERAKEEKSLQEQAERLAAHLSSTKARLSNLEKVVRTTEPRKRKAKAVAK